MHRSTMRFPIHRRFFLWPGLLLPSVLCLGCGEPAVLTADMPLHLEDHLDVATVVGSEVPADLPQSIEWRFDEPQEDWKPVVPCNRTIQPAQVTQLDDALRVTLTEATANPDGEPRGGLYIDLPDWHREDWGYVLVRARTSDKVWLLRPGFNLREDPESQGGSLPFLGERVFRFLGERVFVINDGSVHTYLLRADWSEGRWEGPWQQLGLWFEAAEPASIDILSISLIPKEANYGEAGTGVRAEVRNRVYRRALYMHAPGRLKYLVRVPDAGRLDLGLGVLRDDDPVTFRITAEPNGAEAQTLLEETYGDKERWAQRSVDLSGLAGQTVTLSLEANAEKAGAVALWAAPTLTGSGDPERPNVIFYVIDGGGADYMSVYGYNRRTTPNLERLAAEGAVFERAYSNSYWTKPSTASFMTSLQHSVLGGEKSWGSDPVPEQATTMAQHMHRAGYQTGVFLANPNAGILKGLERGVDMFRESWVEFGYLGGGENHKESSRFLHEAFWRWREEYPAEPYWVHFQTTDVHGDFPAVAPFSGLFVGPEQQKTWREWDERLTEAGWNNAYSEVWEKTGISRVATYTVWQALYDEAMAHNDYQIGRLVERLKAEGEWGNTLLIVGADHSIWAAGADMGIGILDSLPPYWSGSGGVGPMFRPSITRVPLIFVWPGRIAGGQRFSAPVSMIDVLPTILDLVGLPMPEVMQGQSLAPLLLGEEGWEPRPVILDHFEVDRETGEFSGRIEVIDGRWGASLQINPDPEEEPEEQRPVPLLLYDLWNDPVAVHSLHEERPDLVEKYTKFLQAQWEAHQVLAQRFTRSDPVALTPDQLRTLRALGYIQ